MSNTYMAREPAVYQPLTYLEVYKMETTNNTIGSVTLLQQFEAKVDNACEVAKTAYGVWRETAGWAVDSFGSEWLRLKDVAFMSRFNSDERKAFNARSKELRNIVTTRAEARGLSNPRKTWADFVQYAKEQAGLSTAKKSKGGTTSLDKVCEALRMLRNHVNEAGLSTDVMMAWGELESAAIVDGLIKESD